MNKIQNYFIFYVETCEKKVYNAYVCFLGK